MSFRKKLWKDRVSEYPMRRKLNKESGESETVTVMRDEGAVSIEGDAFSAENMNDLETRVNDAFNGMQNDAVMLATNNDTVDSVKFGVTADGKYGYIKTGADTVTPFRNPTGNATQDKVLAGATFSTAALENATGSMKNNGAVNATMTASKYTIPKGYHNGKGTVSLESCTAKPSDVRTGASFYGANGTKQTGTGVSNNRQYTRTVTWRTTWGDGTRKGVSFADCPYYKKLTITDFAITGTSFVLQGGGAGLSVETACNIQSYDPNTGVLTLWGKWESTIQNVTTMNQTATVCILRG